MSSSDLVAELRAEVTHWWEQLQKQQIQAGQQRETSGLGKVFKYLKEGTIQIFLCIIHEVCLRYFVAL